MSKRRNERVSNGWRRRQLRARVLAAYDVCAICGKPVDKTLKTPHPMSAEVDELIPVSRGGDPYSFTNCRLTHRRCNRMKSDKTDEHARALLAGRQEVKAWQTGSESKLDAVQNVRHLTPIPGRGPRVHHLPVASGAVPIFLLKFKRNELCYAYVE